MKKIISLILLLSVSCAFGFASMPRTNNPSIDYVGAQHIDIHPDQTISYEKPFVRLQGEFYGYSLPYFEKSDGTSSYLVGLRLALFSEMATGFCIVAGHSELVAVETDEFINAKHLIELRADGKVLNTQKTFTSEPAIKVITCK